MIKINRPAPPKAIRSRKILETMKALRGKARRNEEIIGKDIPPLWKAVRGDLYDMHHGKCCFCERKRDRAREPDVEHYRPKAGVGERHGHPGYWWLSYDWENLLWSCKACNEDKKGNSFPIVDEKRRAMTEAGNLTDESPLLLNPAVDECEEFFLYDWGASEGLVVTVHPKYGRRKANVTIGILDLNRVELMQERGFHVRHVLQAIAASLLVARQMGIEDLKKRSIADLKKMVLPSSEFAGLARAYFRAFHLEEYF